VADGIRARQEELARLVVAEQGKTITEARGEIGGAAGFFDYFASFARAQVGSMFAPDGAGEQLFIKSVPYGVVAAITPWNFPAAIFARKVAPAIMAGNAIVLKPHENTPLAALALAGIIEEAGVPSGVVNVVTGAGPVVGDALVRHPLTQMVTVTGSVRAGREILAAAAENITPVSLELGGKAPFIVLEDADLDAAVENAVNARFWNCGQVCTCNERHLRAQGPLRRVRRAVRGGRRLPANGRPHARGRADGAEGQRGRAGQGRVHGRGSRKAGGLRCARGGRPEGEEFERGYWFEPTVLTGATNDMDVVQNEVFGPVLPIQAFDDFEDVVDLANDSPYGLTPTSLRGT
jgi:lactaldehyde dehydrogenase/glycolaldehyde dehydrogenase